MKRDVGLEEKEVSKRVPLVLAAEEGGGMRSA